MRFDRRALLAGGAAAMLAGFAGSANADSAPTRLRVVDDRVFVDAVVNGRPTTALLDSGAEMTVLDRAFAARLGISGGSAATVRGTGAATTEARLVRGVEVIVAGLRLRSPTVAVIDLADIARRVHLDRIDVLVGRDLFDAARLAIDLRAGSVRAGASIVPAGVRLPLVPQRGVETIPISIEGSPAQADFDLGNGGSVLIGAGFANRHRMLADGQPLATIPGGGIGGATLQTTLSLRTLDLGGRRFYDIPAAIDTSPTAADANIGVRLLKRFGIVTDFAARSVWLDFRG
ncbi:retropepsin-like domain-containing protein [Polymorphobacter sp. PAMC 29334]|uniref:retropepsin-like aspartic protease n=1 Tax=Polymorphobacter sp. PAMC 29334 TaxID=2862331 RepID=UPI001C68581F|nr:retropepsin-like aspartic protease [Polymorphobacter sp. PAMC 29334]QYE35082.1 retropepsin-like domain-containing protein [Polymorphobacter sp. PAMC 29334]